MSVYLSGWNTCVNITKPIQQQKTSSCTVVITGPISVQFILEHLYCWYWQATILGRRDVKIMKENSSIRKVEIFFSFVGWACFLHKLWMSYENFSLWKNANGPDINSCQKLPSLEEIIRSGIRDCGGVKRCKGLAFI